MKNNNIHLLAWKTLGSAYINNPCITLRRQFASMYYSSSGSFDKENTTNIMSKKVSFSCQALYKKYCTMKWNGRRGVITPSLFFRLWRSVTYLCIISHNCNASESNFKENLGIQDILIHQKSSNLVNSLLLAYATSVNVWDNMASLQWWSHQQRSDWSEIYE